MGKGSGGGGRSFSSMSNRQLIRYARSKTFTDIGQITRGQAGALRGAVRSGKLATTTSYAFPTPKTMYYRGG